MPERPSQQHDATAFREAVSQWQLAARTEVKRASSLPSSMFDACDPMLEASLAESVERMLNCLQQPLSQPELADEAAEMRTEKVSQEELRRLPQLVRGDDREPDIVEGWRAEYLALLADTCAHGNDRASAAAAELFGRDFELELVDDLATMTATLHRCLQELLPTVTEPSAELDAQLLDLCDRLAAGVIARTHAPLADRAP